MNINKITMKSCINYSYVSPSLFRAVVRQFDDWTSFKESVSDISAYGASGGVSGFIYYSDTVPFSKKHIKEIISLAISQSNDFGMDLIEMFKGFNCLKDCTSQEIALCISGNVPEDIETQWFNCLSWYALETVAYEIQAYIESRED